MAIENVELMHECSPEPFNMGKVYKIEITPKKTEDEGKLKRIEMLRSTEGMKRKENPRRRNYSSGLPSPGVVTPRSSDESATEPDTHL